MFLLPPSRVALWVDCSCLSCDFAIAELWSFRNCIVYSHPRGFRKVKEFKMFKTLVLLFCLSVALGEYFFLSRTVLCGVFLHYHCIIEVLLSIGSGHANGSAF